MRHQVRKHRRVASLAGSYEDHQRAAVAVNQLVDLRRQPAARPAQGVISRLDQQVREVSTPPPLCRARVATCW
jgi:hypothetical protein